MSHSPMSRSRRQFFGQMAGGVALAAMPQAAFAQAGSAQDSYPSRPVRWVLGYTTGGTTDVISRLVTQPLTERLGQPFVIEPRPGAGTNLAAEYVVRATPDGYTLLFVGAPNAINPALYAKLNFDFVRDIAPVAAIASVPMVPIVHPSVPATTIPEFIAYARANPKQVNMASSGVGTTPHLAGELFRMMASVDIQHVPYRGSVPAMTDVISGQIPMMMVDLAVAMGNIQEGKLKVYGVTSATRIKAMPDVPTIAEAGLPGFAATGWFSVVTRAGTPRPVIDKINGVLMPYLKRPEVQDKLNAAAITPLTSTPDELAKFIPAEIEKWAKVVKDAGIEPQ